jgi:tRNA (Thr-GGU) A37 N-methylase
VYTRKSSKRVVVLDVAMPKLLLVYVDCCAVVRTTVNFSTPLTETVIVSPLRFARSRAVGIFGHRNMRRINWLGVSRCRLLKVDGLDLHVEDLDAVDGTPVLDIKPWFSEFGPRGEVRQAPWSTEMLGAYFATPPS